MMKTRQKGSTMILAVIKHGTSLSIVLVGAGHAVEDDGNNLLAQVACSSRRHSTTYSM
jgi:hypothetical protein